MLIGKGAPLMEKDNHGDGPMHLAAKGGDMAVLCAIKSAGGCPKLPGESDIKNKNSLINRHLRCIDFGSL